MLLLNFKLTEAYPSMQIHFNGLLNCNQKALISKGVSTKTKIKLDPGTTETPND